MFEAVFPTAFKHDFPNLVGLSGAGSRCGPTWLSSKSRLVVSSVVPATDDSLSIDVNVKNRCSQSRNTKDFEDFCQRPVCGAEMGVVLVVMSLPTSHQSNSIAWRTTQIATR